MLSLSKCSKFVYANSLFVPVVLVYWGHHPWVGNYIRHITCTSVYVVFCMHMYSFAHLIKRTAPPMFSDTAITDRYSDFTFSTSELTGCRYPGLLDQKNCSDFCLGGSRTLDFLHGRRTPYPVSTRASTVKILKIGTP